MCGGAWPFLVGGVIHSSPSFLYNIAYELHRHHHLYSMPAKLNLIHSVVHPSAGARETSPCSRPRRTKQKKKMKLQDELKVLIHCEDGALPFLSPYLLQRYFSPKDPIVNNHLILGIAVKDTCVVPKYGNPNTKISNKKRKALKEEEDSTRTKRQRVEAGTGDDSTNPDGKDMESNSVKKKSPAKSDSISSSNKPIGFTFESKSLTRELCIPEGYHTMSVPTFDLIDDVDAFNKSHGKKKQQNNSTKVNSSLATLSSTKDQVTLCTTHGMQKISPKLYTEVTMDLNCDSTVALFDQSNLDDSERRKRTCTERSQGWFQYSLSHRNTEKGKMDSKNVWLPISCQIGERNIDAYLNDFVKKHIDLKGVALIGWHHFSSRDERISMLKKATNSLRSDKLDISSDKKISILSLQSLAELLDATRNGANVVGTALPASWARSKKALMLSLSDWRSKDTGKEQHDLGLDIHGCIDLSEERFSRDKLPLLSDSTCPLFMKYTRSYIHHLINANELLSEILLFAHNLFQVLTFCKEATLARERGEIDIFCDYVEGQVTTV